MGQLIELGWFRRGAVPRALSLTAEGAAGLAEVFGCSVGGAQVRSLVAAG
jgi:hypothetical protein